MKIREDQVIILGCHKSKDNVKTANAIGTNRFTLVQLELDDDVELKAHDKVFINSDEVKKVITNLGYGNLSNAEKNEFEKAVHTIIVSNSEKYINFFNYQSKESSKLHLLEGISKKASLKFLNKKEEIGKFDSFEEINKKISFIEDSENLIAKRVLYEIIEQPFVKKGRPINLFTDVKWTNKKVESKLDSFEDNDDFFIEKLKKQGLIESSGKRLL